MAAETLPSTLTRRGSSLRYTPTDRPVRGIRPRVARVHHVWDRPRVSGTVRHSREHITPMISTGDMKRGATIELDGRVYQVMEFAHIKMGRGSAQMRMKLRDVRRGDLIERTFQAGEKWPRVRVERVSMQLQRCRRVPLYEHETFDQVSLTRDQVGDAMNFIGDGQWRRAVWARPSASSCRLGRTDDHEVRPRREGRHRDRRPKPATLETGLVVNVPLFVNEGDRIKVNTSTGEYQTRVWSGARRPERGRTAVVGPPSGRHGCPSRSSWRPGRAAPRPRRP